MRMLRPLEPLQIAGQRWRRTPRGVRLPGFVGLQPSVRRPPSFCNAGRSSKPGSLRETATFVGGTSDAVDPEHERSRVRLCNMRVLRGGLALRPRAGPPVREQRSMSLDYGIGAFVSLLLGAYL